MEATWSRAVEALAAVGIKAELERNGVGQLLLTIKGEAVDDWRDEDGPWVSVVADESEAKTVTPTELASEIWGASEDQSRSSGARRIRQVARELFPEDAPGQGGDWQITPAQVRQIRARL